MNTPLSRLLHALLDAALLVMPLVSLACSGPDFTTTLTSDGGGADVDVGADVDYRPIIVYFGGGSDAADAARDGTQDGATMDRSTEERSDATVADAVASSDATVAIVERGDAVGDATTDAVAEAGCGDAASGTHLCGNQCAANDTSACGPSCSVCTAPTGGAVTCNGMQCVQSCATSGYAACSNVCVNETTDPANCGQCAKACTAGTQVCRAANCVNAVHDIGWGTTLSGGSFSLFANILYLLRLPPLAHNATLNTFGTVGNATGPSAKLVLYADNGSGAAPSGTKLAAASSPMTLIAGQKEQTPDTASVVLSAGATYWLGIVVSLDTTIYGQSDWLSVGTKFSQNFTAAWPLGMAGAAIVPASDLAIYINVQDLD